MSNPARVSTRPTVLSLAQLLDQQLVATPALLEPGLLPAQGILFVGGEPKVGKSLLVANLALALAAGSNRVGFPLPTARRVLVCQFELPLPQFVSRLLLMRRGLGAAADHHLLVDTQATGHLLSAPQGLNHFLAAAQAAAAEVIILDPLYSTHDQDENDTRAMAALCQSLLRLRDVTRAALIVVHHVRKSISREEIGSAFRGSSALHAVGDSYMLLTRPSPQLPTLELRFQFRYSPPQAPRLLKLDPQSLWFSGSARESGGHRDFGGFGVLDGQESSSRRCWGNVGTRVRCGFPSAEGEQESRVSYSSRPPAARHFHSKAANSAHFLRNRIFGLPDGLKSSFSRKPPKMHPSSESCAVPVFQRQLAAHHTQAAPQGGSNR